jgi:hypothetical protein
MTLASISVDLDSLPHYCRIHGLPETLLDESARRLAYAIAVPRYLALLADLQVPATFFAIGEDLADPQAAAALKDARGRGVEVGNHTFSHDYALTRLPPEAMALEVRRGSEAIAEAVGAPPVGFRAPGYTLNAALYRVLEDDGYLYDSSVFPAAPYYAVKAAVMGALALARRPSRAILDTPRVLAAPGTPYRPDSAQPYRRGDGQVLELPMTTTVVGRAPFYGTLAAALPRPLVRATYWAARRTPLFNFELHAVDVLGAEDGIPAELVRRQRDLGVPHTHKLARLRDVLGWLKEDFEVVTLAEAARRMVDRPVL